ncbi:MAG: TraR/DksA C4-type zinc finger protein [Thermodesulfobacteriota bacterium]
MDEADKAQECEALDRAAAIRRAAHRRTEEQLVMGGKVFCLGCGEAVPAKRLAAVPDACRCIDCQRELEG